VTNGKGSAVLLVAIMDDLIGHPHFGFIGRLNPGRVYAGLSGHPSVMLAIVFLAANIR
jgi:hypothetical protein